MKLNNYSIFNHDAMLLIKHPKHQSGRSLQINVFDGKQILIAKDYQHITFGLGPYSALCRNHAEKIQKKYTNIYTKIYQKILYIFMYIFGYI